LEPDIPDDSRAAESAAPRHGETLTLSKAELLDAVERLRALARNYGVLLDECSAAELSREAAVSRFQAERLRLETDGPPDSRTGLVIALTRHLLSRLGVDPLRFSLPGHIAGVAARENPELLDYSNRLREHSEPVEARVAEVVRLAEEAAAERKEGLATLLSAIAALFKAMLRQDWSDVTLLLSHINLTTSTRERHELVRQIAKIARDIYNSLHAFSEEISLEGLSSTTEEIPDAMGRLRSVIRHLEKAANANLDALERLGRENQDGQKWAEEALTVAGACEQEYARLLENHPESKDKLEQARAHIRERIAPRLRNLRDDYRANQESLLAMVANQGFQDLTGQGLEKVIHVMESLQFQLIELLKRHTGEAPAALPAADATPEEKAAPAPPAPKTQEEVDRLLTELGF
jgi:chemotaxis protein CheZ